MSDFHTGIYFLLPSDTDRKFHQFSHMSLSLDGNLGLYIAGREIAGGGHLLGKNLSLQTVTPQRH